MDRERGANGAERLCDSLLAHEVDVCFANPGTSEMHFVAALDKRPQMRCVLGLAEGVVTGAADGYGRMADKPAATLLHLGPGLANGLANLHNAKRARTPIINVVGEHATYHLAHDAPLASDIDSLARPMSDWLARATSADAVAGEAASAWQAAVSKPGVSTLVLPADIAWGQAEDSPITPLERPETGRVDRDWLRELLGKIRKSRRTLFLLGGRALREEPLALIEAIAAATGVEVIAETFNARIERGDGRVPIAKLPYPIDLAIAYLAGADCIILVDARPPVAFFAYPDKPSLLYEEDCEVHAMVRPDENLLDALDWLAGEVGARRTARTSSHPRSQATGDLPTRPLTAEMACAIVAALLPPDAVITDETVTSGRAFFKASQEGPRHDYLQLTGGSIGIGLPLATGAAIACPGRPVICLQADGSAMYTIQALWTQAREKLDITTIIFSNRAYAILDHEMRNLGIGNYGESARSMLKLDKPHLDWTALAQGHGVDAVRVETGKALADALRSAFRRKGPFLIEAVI